MVVTIPTTTSTERRILNMLFTTTSNKCIATSNKGNTTSSILATSNKDRTVFLRYLDLHSLQSPPTLTSEAKGQGEAVLDEAIFSLAVF